MQFAELDHWPASPVLSKSELARINRVSADSGPADKYSSIILWVWLVGGLASTSIFFNIIRLVWAQKPRLTRHWPGNPWPRSIGEIGLLIDMSISSVAPRLHREVAHGETGGTRPWRAPCSVRSYTLCSPSKGTPIMSHAEPMIVQNLPSNRRGDNVKDLKYGPYQGRHSPMTKRLDGPLSTKHLVLSMNTLINAS